MSELKRLLIASLIGLSLMGCGSGEGDQIDAVLTISNGGLGAVHIIFYENTYFQFGSRTDANVLASVNSMTPSTIHQVKITGEVDYSPLSGAVSVSHQMPVIHVKTLEIDPNTRHIAGVSIPN